MALSAKTWARIGAVCFVAFALTVSVLSARRGPAHEAVDPLPAGAPDVAVTDPLMAELSHCQAIGQAGASDPDCLRAWAQNRRRFLTLDAQPQAPTPAGETPVPSALAAPDGSRP
jgi:conjugative transfer region protein TrbK